MNGKKLCVFRSLKNFSDVSQKRQPDSLTSLNYHGIEEKITESFLSPGVSDLILD